jgi:hypothetical protein
MIATVGMHISCLKWWVWTQNKGFGKRVPIHVVYSLKAIARSALESDIGAASEEGRNPDERAKQSSGTACTGGKTCGIERGSSGL